MGVLAVYGYGLPEVGDKHYGHLNDIIQSVRNEIELSNGLTVSSVASSSTRSYGRTFLRIACTLTTNMRKSCCRTRRRFGRRVEERESVPSIVSSGRDESVKIEYKWKLDRFVAYVSTWSGYVHYMQKHPGRDVLLDFRQE